MSTVNSLRVRKADVRVLKMWGHQFLNSDSVTRKVIKETKWNPYKEYGQHIVSLNVTTIHT